MIKNMAKSCMFRFARAFGFKKVPMTYHIPISKNEHVAISSNALKWLLSIEKKPNMGYVIPISKKETLTISETGLEWFLKNKA